MNNSTTIVVKDICKSTLSNSDGVALKICIINALTISQQVVLSFKGIDSVSSSFLNSSIGEVVDSLGYNTLKNRVRINNYTPHLAKIIQDYIATLNLHKA